MTRPQSEYERRCATKAGRAAMVDAMQALAAELGVACEVGASLSPRSARLTLSRGPYRVGMHFAGGSKVSAFLGHWHTDYNDKEARFPDGFGLVVCGTINPYHHRKATTCVGSFDLFCAAIRGGFAKLKGDA